MIVDTSVWIEYLRATGSPEHLALRARVEAGEPIATPAPVVMELLAGCPDEKAARALTRMLSRFEVLEVEGLVDFEDAALIQRRCTEGGTRIRSMIDCLIAAVALREGRPLLARDCDFESIACHFELELVTP